MKYGFYARKDKWYYQLYQATSSYQTPNSKNNKDYPGSTHGNIQDVA